MTMAAEEYADLKRAKEFLPRDRDSDHVKTIRFTERVRRGARSEERVVWTEASAPARCARQTCRQESDPQRPIVCCRQQRQQQ